MRDNLAMVIPLFWRTQAGGRRARAIKGARHSHATIRAQGKVPGYQLNAALARKHGVSAWRIADRTPEEQLAARERKR